RVARGGEDGALVIPEHLEPVGDVGGMVFAWLERDVEVGAEEGGAQFGHELLHISSFSMSLRTLWRIGAGYCGVAGRGSRAVLGLAIVFISLGLILLGCLPRVVELEEK